MAIDIQNNFSTSFSHSNRIISIFRPLFNANYSIIAAVERDGFKTWRFRLPTAGVTRLFAQTAVYNVILIQKGLEIIFI